ncbi:hypothetical protein [Amphritea balenae]|uniref:Sulfotransferase domain-containing protein n=1 Tax=Amphritea balenae TaxID=452629 RepID=A0A3P1SWG5_9GAMM|nr:hypothetical protein [Amphritea balenae]RRD01315.1 hypothetical protein EHS89_01770 [Amphritea balenae]GGK58228.1 hypothetical protein GCM10007941_05420 [Amphritea balenae]
MRKVKVYVHLGMPKTGTSALQSLLYHNRNKLKKCGFYYPDFGQKQHYPFVRALSEEAGSPSVFPGGGDQLSVSGFVKKIKRDIKKFKIHTVILSSEFFFDYAGLTPDRDDRAIGQALPFFKNVAQIINNNFHDFDVQIVTWLRRQDDWLMSMYNNVVKAHNFRNTFDHFERKQVAPFYGSILSQWGDVFGDDNINVFVYQKGKPEFNVISTFLNFIDGPIVDDLEQPEKNVREGNIGLPRDLMIIKREFNRGLSLPAPKVRAQLEDHFFTLADQPRFKNFDQPLLSPQKRLSIIEFFNEENQIVVDRFMKDRSGRDLFEYSSEEFNDWKGLNGIDPVAMNSVYAGIITMLMKKINYLEGEILDIKSKRF